jgi:hypothetical protein
MRIRTFILIFPLTIVLSVANGQLKMTDLYGDWETNNKDSLYYKSDTVDFIQDINYFYGVETCDIVVLRISEKEFKFIKTFLCTEPGRERWTNGTQSINIKKVKSGQVIEIKILDKVERFSVLDYKEERIDRYPWDIKKLKLKRL